MKPRGMVFRYGGDNAAGSLGQQLDGARQGAAAGNLNAAAPSDLGPSGSAAARQCTLGDDKNLMPSMVVRQQRNQSTHSQTVSEQNQQRGATRPGPSLAGPPASTDKIFEEAKRRAQQAEPPPPQQHSFDQDGLILPKKVLPYHQNGSLDVQRPAIRDLNRELKFNQVRGKNVLDQKSELKKALEKLEANRRRKEAEQERLTRRTSLELRLEERARVLALKEDASETKGQPTSNILIN